MARKPQPAPEEQLPPLEYIVALIDRLQRFKNDPIAKLALVEARAAERIYRRDLKAIIDGELKGER